MSGKQIKIRIWDRKNNKYLFQGDILSEAMLLSLTIMEDYSNFEVSRYTGLKDKKGIEIWEGDCFFDGHSVGKIIFDFGQFWFEVYISIAFEISNLYEVHKKGQVIGNIYENNIENLWDLVESGKVND